MSENDREKKYALLKDEIIDQGYEPLAFQVFCETLKRDGGEDIDAWGYEELNTTIQAFKKKEDQNMSQMNQSLKSSRIEETKEQLMSQVDLNKSELSQQVPSQPLKTQTSFQSTKAVDDINFSYEIECKLPQRSELTDYMFENENKTVEIIMNEYITKQEGLFSSSYGAFRIETKPIGWSVWRRFSDFIWIRQTLVKAFPFQVVPPIPRKKIKVHATDATYLQKRMRVLELFLQNCLHHTLFRTHPAFSEFLQISDDTKLKERQAHYDRVQAPQRPADFTTVKGSCNLEISEKLNNYASTLQDYLKNSSDVYSKLGSNFKKFFLDLDTLSSTLQNIQDNFQSLSKVTELFCKTNQLESIVEMTQIKDVYQQLAQLMQGWYDGTIFQMKNVKENFYEFFRYHRKMQDQANEFITLRNTMASKFNDIKSRLNDKKEKLFVVGDVSKWDLSETNNTKEIQFNKSEAFKFMLPQETKALEIHRENYGFINKQMTEEMNQIMSFRSIVYTKKFLRVAQMRALETAKLHHVLADFLQNLSEIQGKMSGSLQRNTTSLFVDPKYDTFFGLKPTQQK